MVVGESVPISSCFRDFVVAGCGPERTDAAMTAAICSTGGWIRTDIECYNLAELIEDEK
jgi:hypothetical protein